MILSSFTDSSGLALSIESVFKERAIGGRGAENSHFRGFSSDVQKGVGFIEDKVCN